MRKTAGKFAFHAAQRGCSWGNTYWMFCWRVDITPINFLSGQLGSNCFMSSWRKPLLRKWSVGMILNCFDWSSGAHLEIFVREENISVWNRAWNGDSSYTENSLQWGFVDKITSLNKTRFQASRPTRSELAFVSTELAFEPAFVSEVEHCVRRWNVPPRW